MFLVILSILSLAFAAKSENAVESELRNRLQSIAKFAEISRGNYENVVYSSNLLETVEEMMDSLFTVEEHISGKTFED